MPWGGCCPDSQGHTRFARRPRPVGPAQVAPPHSRCSPPGGARDHPGRRRQGPAERRACVEQHPSREEVRPGPLGRDEAGARGGSSLPWPRCPGRAPPNPGTLRSGMPPPLRGPAPSCHTRAHEVLASGLCRLGRPSPATCPGAAGHTRTARHTAAGHARSRALAHMPVGRRGRTNCSRRPPGRGPSCAPFRGPGPSLPLAAGPRLPTPLWPLSRRALSPLPSGWLAAPLRPRPARPCADSADPASATAGSCVFPAGSPCSPSQPLGPRIACGAAKAGRLPERRLLGRKPGWSAVGAACVVALPRAPATSSPPPGSQNPRAGPPGAHCRSHMLWQAQHPAETPPTAWPPLRPAGCPGLVPAGGPACFWHLVCGLRLPK